MGRKQETHLEAEEMEASVQPRRSARKSSNIYSPSAGTSSSKMLPYLRTPQKSTATSSIMQADDEDELDEIVVKPSSEAGKTSKVLKEVSITVKTSSAARSRPTGYNRLSTESASPFSSAFDSSSARASNQDTPATSAMSTPAESTMDRQLRIFGSAGALEASKRWAEENLGNPYKAAKRKRIEADPPSGTLDTSNDAALAQALQEQEYGVSTSKRNKTYSFASGSTSVARSDAETESLSDLTSLASVTPEPTSRRAHLARAATARSARDDARRTLSMKARALAESDVSDAMDFQFADATDDDEDFVDVVEEDYYEEVESEIEGEPGTVSDAASHSSRQAARVAAFNVRTRSTRARHSRSRGMTRAQRGRMDLEENHPEITTMWDDLKAIVPIPKSRAPQPAGINRQLKEFQLEGLNWMIKQEKSKWKGGLLGDEMGMGKTIQAVSLIMSDYPASTPSLVVVPPVALMQWQSEINSYTNGKLKVLVYHGTRPEIKKMKKKDLMKYDVIMISYSTLASIYGKQSKGWTRGDVLIKEDSLVHSLHYHRIILDEAHSIKSRVTQTAKACFALKGDFKWCLSGTPVQNRIGEFFSLLRFLNVTPFACYFCKSCSCASLHWSIDKKTSRCTACSCASTQHVSVFNQEILNPITDSDQSETGNQARRGALAKLRLITDRIMLRRVKQDHTSSMELPPKEVIIHNEFFADVERDFSMSIMTNNTRQFDTYVARGVMLNNYANIFGLIMQMRQVANHPDLLLRRKIDGGENVLVCGICDEPAEDAIEASCHDHFCRSCVRSYIDSFDTVAEGGASPDCPRCHRTLAIDLEQPDIGQNADEEVLKKSSIINRIDMDKWISSTKIEMLVHELYQLRSKKQTLKSIVFSQFTSMLQLVEWRLRRAGFNTVMLDGSMTPEQRQKAINFFMNNANVEVFLVSLKAGGVALNLTEASRVFIIDPWWNPAAEWQSADRCHRIGQQRPCVITRLVIEDSVESRMVLLQEKKTNMINGTINNDDVAMDRLTPEDMQFLFRG